MNGWQRGLLGVAALLMLLFAFGTATGYEENASAVATVQFVVAVALMFFALKRSPT